MMGQSTSLETHRDPIGNELDFLHEQIRRHSSTLRQLTLLTYDELHKKIDELNTLSEKFVDCNGKQLTFEVKSGTEKSILWKGTVRIKCNKVDPKCQMPEKTRELTLKQFLQVYNTMEQQLRAREAGQPSVEPAMDASVFLDKASEEPECCICMERKPEVSLPCAHSYCLACIEQWNVSHKTCPICREKLETTDETWVLEESPHPNEVNMEIQKSLFDLTR